ncbi:hypothetical protein Riv7116_1213 [Rivularia sp. PCC 7116]|uniref:hypothetical protein n=1 Tax=Rivularia sp. PCC 7116 TaxID=373994 RepID=UPI00029F34D4|nr:hypothetical protein [Rivularia sp. PCC 7116]AFY53783.1 hypothetical protein Riv7116_1213 [Rivularia sp. PCC 7116]
MFYCNKYKVIASLNLGIVLLTTGCNETKLAQCQRLIKVVNEGNSLIEKNKGSQVTLSLGLAKDLDNVAKKVERQNFQDPKLGDFKNQYAKHFQAKSKNINSAAKALGASKTAEVSSAGREQVRKAKKDIETSLKQVKDAAKESDTLAKELNDYCTQTE